jgi:hypothetical protein
MNLENQVTGVTHKIQFVARGSKEVMDGDLTTTHSTSHNGRPVLMDPTTGTAYAPEEIAGVASGPEQEPQLRDAGYSVVGYSELEGLRAR